jgi:hypothetical protein
VQYNDFYSIEPDDADPYTNSRINSKYYDMSTVPTFLAKSKCPIFLSINIQSLQSKYDQLKMQIGELLYKGVKIDVIAIQETWEVRYTDLFDIPGFQRLICKTREGMRGGGCWILFKRRSKL